METVSSVTDQCVISLSLLANIDPDAIIHPDLRIGWEEVLGEPVEQYAGVIVYFLRVIFSLPEPAV